MSKYTKQAEKFCKKYNVKVSIKFLRLGLYFQDDKILRNIYRITIESPMNKFSCKFGDSINNTEKGLTPSVYDVLACLTKYDVGDLVDFCSEFGYDIDSKKVEKTYKLVIKEWLNVDKTFTDEALKELQEIN